MLLAVSAAATAGEPARIETPSGIVIEGGIGVGYVWLPRINGFATVIDEASFLFIRQSDGTPRLEDVLASGHMRISVPGGRAGLPWRLNVALAGATASDKHGSTIATAGGEFLDILPISGAASPGAIASGGTPATLRARADADYVLGSVAAELPGAMRFGPITTGVEVGLAYMRMGSTWNAQHIVTGTTAHSLNEEAVGHYVGPMLGFNSVYQLRPGVRLVGYSRIYGFWYDGDLDARQTSTLLGPLAVSDSDNGFGVRLDSRYGLELSGAGGTRVGFYATSSWQQNVAQIVNPRSGPGIDANAVTFTPTHLEKGEMSAIGGEVRFIVPLN
jgi:hypothetical protein